MQSPSFDLTTALPGPAVERRERRRNSQIRDIALWVGAVWDTAEFVAIADFVVLPARGDNIQVRAGAAAAVQGRVLDLKHNVGGGDHQIDILVHAND